MHSTGSSLSLVTKDFIEGETDGEGQGFHRDSLDGMKDRETIRSVAAFR